MKILKQWKKGLEISFYASVPKIMICYPVPEIWHMLDVIVIFHFGQCLALLPHWQLKKWKFQNNGKTPGDIIILHKYTKNHDYILYCSWDVVHEGFSCYFSFWAIFAHYFRPKNENFKKMKKEKNTSVPKIMIICCTVPEIWCMTDVIIFNVGLFFCPFTPLTA